MNKNEIAAGKNATATNSLDKVNRQANQGILDLVFGFVSLTGTLVQTIGSLGKTATAVKGVGTALKALPLAAISGPFAAGAAAVAAFLGATRALSFNFLGLTDVLSGVGKAFGDVLPAMRGFLTGLEDAGRSTADFFTRYTEGIAVMAGLSGAKIDYTKAKFGELTEQYIKTGTTGSAVFDKIIAQTVAWAKENGVSMEEVIAKAHALDDQQVATAASTEKLGGAMASTIDYTKGFNSILQGANDGLSSVGSTVIKVGGSFVELHGTLTDLGNGYSEINGQIIKNSDILNKTGLSTDKAAESAKKLQANWQDVTATAADMGSATADLNTTLSENIDKNFEQAHAILTLVDSEQNHTEAISAVNLAYAQSVDKVADLTSVLSDSQATHEAVATQVNNTTAALMEEAIKLEAASQSADSHEQSLLRLDNAYKSGVVSIKEWANGLAEAQQQQAGQSAALAEMGARWSDIPPFVERNIETLKLFGLAAKQGGEAAKEAAGMAADAWRDATSEMGSEIENLAGILMEGGKEMKESTKEWFTGIEQNIGRELTAAEQTALKGIGQMMASTEQAINDWQLGQLMGESISGSGAQLASAFDSLAASAEGGMKEVFSRAAAIVRSDSSLANAVNEVMANVGKTSPQALLAELNAILPPGLKDSATKAGEGVKGALDPGAAAAGQSAALTLSQEFAAAGTHIAAVISGMGSNMSGLEQTARTAGQNAAVALSEGFAAAGTHIASVLKGVAASISKVMGAARAGAGAGLRIPIIVDTRTAVANINKLKTQIAGIKQAKPVPINLNIAPAVSAANKIRSIVNALPNIKRSITYTYRVVGSRPNPPNINKTITYRYRTVGSRPAQTGMHETLGEDTMIAAHAGERVDITPNTINTNEERVALVPGGSRGRGAEYVIPVTLMLDNKVLVRTVSRGLMEDVGGVS